ncbi:MAG: DUF3592 domain-containing protein [Planctomycetaceae bacterium]
MSRGKQDTDANKALSVEHERSSVWGTLFVFGFFGLFGVAGAVAFYFLTIQPLWDVFRASSWVETPCTVLSSAVETHPGDESDTYSIEIEYEYVFQGQRYQGDRYHFMVGNSSGRKWKQAVVDAHPVGHQTICYVDSAKPSEAVLHRGLTVDMWWGLFPIPFLAVGIVPPVLMLRGKRKNDVTSGLAPATTNLVTNQSSDLPELSSDGPVTLKAASSPWGSFIGSVIVCLFWNGIISIPISEVVQSWRDGDPEYVLTFFMIPFALVGLGIVAWMVYAFIALFNPRPTLTISRGSIPLGETAHVWWSFQGSTYSIRVLKLTLKGVEKATYRRGTDTHTDEETFYEEVLSQHDQAFDIASGEVDVTIPADSMHTFKSDNNEIVWSLHLTGDIPARPDVNAIFPIKVVPHQGGER